MFGWNALALMLTDQGIYSAGCTDEVAGRLACVIAGLTMQGNFILFHAE